MVLDVLHGYLILASKLNLNKRFNGQVLILDPLKSNYRVLDVVNEIKKIGIFLNGNLI